MKKVILLSVSILLISSMYSFAEVPCKINYQGRLIKDNVPVDGTKTMVFSIYDSAVGPNELWTSGNVSVEVHNGLFRYVLDLSSIDWAAGETLYLEVKVETDILTPREELYAYPYAINSHLLEGETKEYFINTSGDSQTKQGNLNIMSNVGIGTTSPHPWGVLTLADNLVFSEQDKDYFITGPANGGAIRLRSDGDGTNRYINLGQMNNNKVFFPHLTVADGGNVGIGTTDPQGKLDVAGNYCQNGNSLFVIKDFATSYVVSYNVGSSYANIATVTVNTTSANDKILVFTNGYADESNNDDAIIVFYVRNATDGINSETIKTGLCGGVANIHGTAAHLAGTFVLGVNSAGTKTISMYAKEFITGAGGDDICRHIRLTAQVIGN
ncbi:hypothetical protein ES705_09938 [subsurface metagenome]